MPVPADSVEAIANEIIAQAGGQVDALKLQKLLYYVQVYSVVLHGELAYTAKIEAWRNGPVIREVWEMFKHYSQKPITVGASRSRPRNPVSLQIIALVMAAFGLASGVTLSDQTHQETPWYEAYIQARNVEITMQAIQHGYVRVGENVQALPQGVSISLALREKLEALKPGRDNEGLIAEVADENYNLLTYLVQQNHAATLPESVLAAMVRGVALEWTTDPAAARAALLISLDRPERTVQYEAMEGLDEMWREGESGLVEEVALHHVAIQRPSWALIHG